MAAIGSTRSLQSDSRMFNKNLMVTLRVGKKRVRFIKAANARGNGAIRRVAATHCISQHTASVKYRKRSLNDGMPFWPVA